jgi:transposase
LAWMFTASSARGRDRDGGPTRSAGRVGTSEVRQSGSSPARHGGPSKEGPAAARHVLVEATWITTRSPGPLCAFGQRVAARLGKHIAAVAVARKLATLAWHRLTHEQDYAFQRPTLTRPKLRRLELMTGGPRVKPGPNHLGMPQNFIDCGAPG